MTDTVNCRYVSRGQLELCCVLQENIVNKCGRGVFRTSRTSMMEIFSENS